MFPDVEVAPQPATTKLQTLSMQTDFPFSTFHFPSIFNRKIFKSKNKWQMIDDRWQIQRGYTLIEILVALTIIGLLFSVGYANFRSFSQRQVVLDAAKNLQGDLRLAQQMALSGQKPDDPNCNSPNTLNGYDFNIVSGSSYEIKASCSGGTVSAAEKTVDVSSGAAIASPFPSPNPILFKVLGNGTNISAGGSASIKIVQTGTTNQTTVTIGAGGQIQ
jgi:prepilin-type N-terminal cleavage/methylation domain-containing protein